MIATRISPVFSAERPGPVAISETGSERGPSVPTSSARAPRQISNGTASADGAGVAKISAQACSALNL